MYPLFINRFNFGSFDNFKNDFIIIIMSKIENHFH